MTPKQIIDAYRGIRELANITLPFKVSRGILKLKKAIDEEFEAVRSYEEQLAERFAGKNEPGGRLSFATREDADAFLAEKEKFMAEENEDIKLPTVDLSKVADQIRVSAAAMEALDGLVKFEEGDD